MIKPAIGLRFEVGDQVVIRASFAETPDVGTVIEFKKGGGYLDEQDNYKPFYLVEVKFWTDPEAVHVFWNYELNYANV